MQHSQLEQKTLESQGLLNADVVRKIWTDFIDRGEWRIQIWYVLMFQEWLMQGERL